MSRSADELIRAEALRRALPISELYRQLLSIGWANYRKEHDG